MAVKTVCMFIVHACVCFFPLVHHFYFSQSVNMWVLINSTLRHVTSHLLWWRANGTLFVLVARRHLTTSAPVGWFMTSARAGWTSALTTLRCLLRSVRLDWTRHWTTSHCGCTRDSMPHSRSDLMLIHVWLIVSDWLWLQVWFNVGSRLIDCGFRS